MTAVRRLGLLAPLAAFSLAGPEQSALRDDDVAFHRGEFERLRAELEHAHRSSKLPEHSTSRPALNDLLLRLRLPA